MVCKPLTATTTLQGTTVPNVDSLRLEADLSPIAEVGGSITLHVTMQHRTVSPSQTVLSCVRSTLHRSPVMGARPCVASCALAPSVLVQCLSLLLVLVLQCGHVCVVQRPLAFGCVRCGCAELMCRSLSML